MTLLNEAHATIREYSSTWYEPVLAMPPGLHEATACAYLCMRAIDEIEDHPHLDGESKAGLLGHIGRVLQTRFRDSDFATAFRGHEAILPEVTLRLGEWTTLASPSISPRVLETFATMAGRMAVWAERGFAIHTESDLDRYTYAVAGTLVLLLSDLWCWHDGTRTNRTHGIGYGRALQAVNILLDRDTDLGRGADFWPDGWTRQDMITYARRELPMADAYIGELPSQRPAHVFCAGALTTVHRALGGGVPDRA